MVCINNVSKWIAAISTQALILCALIPVAYGQGPGNHMQAEDCPPGTQGPFSDCASYHRAINIEALRIGYADKNGNGTADFLEDYIRGEHDCADTAAEVACVSNQSHCINQTASQLRSNSANHSTNSIEGIGECDFTPMLTRGGSTANNGSGGMRIGNRRDTTIDSGAPDAGEKVDPAYTCELNGASRSAYGGRGGGGGMFDSPMGMLAMMTLLLNQAQNQQDEAVATPVAEDGGVNQLGTPTPTPLPTETPQETPISDRSAAEVSSPNKPSIAESSDLSASIAGGSLSDAGSSRAPGLSSGVAKVDEEAEWARERGDIFGGSK